MHLNTTQSQRYTTMINFIEHINVALLLLSAFLVWFSFKI